MIEFPTGTARNLQEQVAKNKKDIEDIIQGNKILSEFGISVVGSVATEADLPNPATYAGKYGDAYTVGSTNPYDYYVFTRPTNETPEAHWFNLGQFPAVGPQGAQGDQGEKGDPGSKIYIQANNPTVVTGFNLSDLWINSSNGSLYQLTVNGWNYVGTFKGEQGAQGLQGVQGERGPRGVSYSLLGVLSSTSLLPQPSSMESMQNGYLIGSQAPYNIYLITGNPDDSSTWVWQNVGSPYGGTDVQVGGISQATWNADSKQDKDIGATSSMMASEYSNEMVRMEWSYEASSYSFAKRREEGRLRVGTPSNDNDAANKAYVDSKVQSTSYGILLSNSQYTSTTTQYATIREFVVEAYNAYLITLDINFYCKSTTTTQGAVLFDFTDAGINFFLPDNNQVILCDNSSSSQRNVTVRVNNRSLVTASTNIADQWIHLNTVFIQMK